MQNFDPEKLIENWWSASSPLTLESEEWIEKSYGDQDAFWNGLFVLHQKNKRTPSQSALSSHYDFYHDCIVRHLSANDLAYTVVKKEGTENWTYKQLHRIVNFHVKKWSKHKPQIGQMIALTLSPGIEFVIALLTSLRFGLTICFLPSNSLYLGKQQIKKMLSAIKPQFLVTDKTDLAPHDLPLLEIDVKGQEEENHQPHSTPYKAAAQIQTALSLYRQEPLTFVPLDAHTTYLHALRDSLFALNLPENVSWASPLACPIRTEPCSTLMTFLAGARKVYVPDDAIRQDPDILRDEKLHIIGISNELQKLWSRSPSVPSRYLKVCYKNPMDINYLEWKSFVQLNKIDKVPGFQLVMDNSVGGISLLSRPHPDNLDFMLKPSPGCSWSLDDIGGKPVKSTCGYGLFNTLLSCPENGKKTSNLALAQVGKRCSLNGTIKPPRDGVTVPVHDLEEMINNLPFVESSFLHPTLIAGQASTRHYTLLVFVNPMKQDITPEEKGAWHQQITQNIIDNLGSGFLPDAIEFYPFLPRVRSQALDRSWCTHQFSDGLLLRKMEKPLYKYLNILKKLSLGSTKLHTLLKNGE